MALIKNRKLNKVEIKGDYKIIIAEYINEILDDNQVVAESYERQSFTPDTNIADLPTELQAYANTAWTADVISSYSSIA